MKVKRFSTTYTLNTNGALGFRKGRKYDQDFNRLGRNEVRRELTDTNELSREMRKLSTELNEGRRGLWRDTE